MIKRFRPKRGQSYYMLNSRWEVKVAPFTNSQKACDRVKAGNAFRSNSEAADFAKDILALRRGEVIVDARKLSTIKRFKFLVLGRIK